MKEIQLACEVENFTDLSIIPYFPDRDDLPIIREHPELRNGEKLRILIPENIVVTRIRALAEKIEAEVSPNPDNFVFGAILEGGRYLLTRMREFLPPDLNARIPIEYLDIKSRLAIKTGNYEIKKLPRPEIVNGKIYRVFEGVADSGRTIEITQAVLSQPPYYLRELRVALLMDKKDAHEGVPLASCVDHCLLAMGEEWMVGCGPDTDGRFRNLPYVALYKKGD